MNRRQEQVTYRPFSTQPVLQQGLLPIERYDGDLERRVAAGLARIADTFAARAEQEAQFAGTRDGRTAAMTGAPTPATINGGDVTGTASINGQAGHIVGAQAYQPPKGIRATVPPSELTAAAQAASEKYGVDPHELTNIAFLESSYNPNSVNGSMKGLYNFSPDTARQYGLTDPFNIDQSTDAAARLLRDNNARLEKTLNRKASAGERYLAHQQGVQGALNLLARPDAKAADVVGLKAVVKNGGRADMTAGEFAKLWTGKLDTSAVRDSQKRAADLPIVLADAKGLGRLTQPDIGNVKPDVLAKFKDLQNAWGSSIPIASGFRDQARNDAAGGAKKSQHIDGNALDLDVKDMPVEQRKELIKAASAMGFTGIGVYANSIHIDMGARRSWGPNYHAESVPDWAKDVVGEHLAGSAKSTAADSYARLPDKSDARPNVTAVRTPLEITPGEAGTFRPTGQNTIYGRAYDVEGTRTWLQMAKMTIVQEQAEIYDKYKDDPAQLQAAYGRLLEDHKREGVYFPEVAPEYELSFKSNAFGLVQQARQDQAKKQEQVDRVDFIDRISGLEDRKSQMMAGIDPRDPQSSGLLADMQGTIDSHYDSAVSRGILSPDEASKAKAESKSAMVVPYYLKQAEGLKADEIDVLHGRMKADYAAGTLAGVTVRDWADIEQGLSSAVGTRRTNDDKADKDLMARGDDVFHRLLRGEPVAPSDLARIRTDALTAPHGDDIIASTDARMRLATALRTQPIDAVEGKLDAILRGDRAKASVEDVEFARTQIAEVRKNLTVDPLGVAESFGIIPAMPPIALDGLKDPAALRDALAYRRGAATAAANHFGVPVRYFRPGEAAQVVSQAMANPDAMVAFTLNVTQSFGKDTPAAMREISEDGPVMAHAVGLSVSTGDASLARDVAAISVMKARKDYSVKMPEAGRLETRGSTFLAGALASQPQMQHAALATANLLFEKMAGEQGFDPADIKTEGSVADLAYRRALDRALGAQKISGIETGGLGLVNDLQIIVPPLMAKDRPDELLGGLTTKQLERLPPLGSINGVAVSASQIRDGYLVSVGDGLYRVTTNDPQGDDPAYLIAPDGKPWLLDIRQLDRINRDTKPEFRPVYRSNPGYQ